MMENWKLYKGDCVVFQVTLKMINQHETFDYTKVPLAFVKKQK